MSNKQTNQKKTFVYIIASLVAVLLVIVLIRGSESSSTLAIAPLGAPAQVFIDRNQVDPLRSTSSPTTYSVTSGQHQVLVARDGYWPWSEEVTVAPEETTEIVPFLIEETGRQVLQTSTEIQSALVIAKEESVPTADEPVISADGNVQVFVDNETNILAQWTAGTSSTPDYFNCRAGTCGVSVYNQAPVRQVSFYPGHSDVILFATETAVFAIEIDPSGETQNFQPITEAASQPVFTADSGSIFVLAGQRITVSDL
jgi:hypothetical protein